MPAVSVDHVSKTYGSKKSIVKALDDVSFTVKKGELVGVIGPDGEGKQSLCRMWPPLLIPGSGPAWVCGDAGVQT